MHFTAVVAILTALVGPAMGEESTKVKVNPMPKPVSIEWGDSGPKLVSGGLWLDTKSPHPIVNDAFNRMQNSIRELKWSPIATPAPFPSSAFEPFPTGGAADSKEKRQDDSPMLNSVKLTVEDVEADLQHKVDESYELSIKQDSQEITINSKTVWGALHAFTTLQQIVIANDNGGFIVEHPVEIKDEPKFPHRGVMIDSARNFVSKKAILRQLDGMSLAKLNVMHWHMVDSQAWPIEIPSFPDMTKDAYSPNKVFSTKDITDIIDYARARGVRVIPELDIPGHSSAGYKQLPDADKILACENSFWSNDIWEQHTAVEPNPGQLDILAPETYDVLEKVYGDLSKVFKDNVFHVGMDELQANCYNYSEPIMKWMNEGGHDFFDLAQYWVDKAIPIFNKVENRKLMMWEDVVLSEDISAKDVPKDIIMQSWNAVGNIKKLTSQGYDVVVSNSDWFYLDCGYSQWALNDPRVNEMVTPDVPLSPNFQGAGFSWCGPYKSWQRIYSFDMDFNLTKEELEHVIGGEAPLWAEQVDDTVIDGKMWPRAAALGELLWSSNRDSEGHKRTTEAGQRILNFREYLVASGINAAPLVPEYCWRNPHHCDLYRNQTALDDYFNNTPAAV